MSGSEAVSRLVVFGDACGSGTLGMTAKKRMRDALYGAFDEAFAAVDIAPRDRHQEDRGDGILTALDPGAPLSPMVGVWFETLYQNLREHNAESGRRLRLRIGMNAGPVLDDGRGLVGKAVDLACRLCDSPAAKGVMTRAPGSDLLLVVSDWLYRNVVAEGGRQVEPEQYVRARVRFKETDEQAWLHIPRLSASALSGLTGAAGPPGPDGDAARRETGGGPTPGDGPPPPTPTGTATAAAPGRTITAHGDLQIFDNNVINGFTGIDKRRSPDSPERGERT
ncbi:hypothetical protein AB0O07_01145 [Streptomyces sp. NPDC093085]|uniref:hypothetical protein n=1 Tax=Streptomyces sp. NPDC093085 TaxID=3155068 RepID=UPI003427FC55